MLHLPKTLAISAAALFISSVSHADFNSAEFGTGTFATGDGSATVLSVEPAAVSQSLCGGDGCDSAETAALNALGNSVIADGSIASNGTASQDAIVNFFDPDQDGSMTAAEVVNKFAAISGISFTSVSNEQAGALLKGIASHCTAGIDAACLELAASDGNDFIDDAVAGTSNLSALKNAMVAGTNYSVTDSDPLKIFDTDKDGEISDSEFVALLALDGDAGSSVNTSSNGLYARAYVSELQNGLSVASAVATGNTYAVHPPKLGTISTISLNGTNSTHESSVINVYDGNCAASDGSGCTAAPASVTHTIAASHTAPGSSSTTSVSGTKFTLNSSGKITLANGVNIEDLDAGTYSLTISSTDANTKTYGKTATKAATLKVSNEDGCITNTQVTGADFNATGNISGAAVSITGSWDDDDLLFIQGSAVTVNTVGANAIKRYTNLGVSGVSRADYDPSTGIMRFYGSTTEANWVSLFKRVGYIFDSGSNNPASSRSLAFTLSNRVPYLHDDGTYHFYEYFRDRRITFSSARTKASHSNKELFGMTGYLATPTSAEEQAILKDKVQGVGWIGACDRLDSSTVRSNCGVSSGDISGKTVGEGHWYWVTGPEKMTYFGHDNESASTTAGRWAEPTGNNEHGTGKHTNVYENWNGTPGVGEPNNCCGSAEHYLHVWGHAKWNDFAHWNRYIDGYLVEWGGQSGDSSVDIDQSVTYSIPSGDANFCAYAE